MSLFPLTIPNGDPRLPLPPLPSPSPVIASILEAVRERMTGNIPKEHLCDVHFHLPRGQLADLWKHLQADGDDQQICRYFDDKAHFDYFASDETFVLRMDSVLHAYPCARLVRNITEELDRICREKPALRDILEHAGCFPASSSLAVPHNPDGALSYHSPYSQFELFDYHWPTVVIEASYTEKPRRLSRLAYEYIAGTDGETRAVIGLEHRHGALVDPKRASLKVWRMEKKVDDDGEELCAVVRVHNEDFRDKHGNPCPGSLTLPLTDFVPPNSVAATAVPDLLEAAVSISYPNLCKALSTAERRNDWMEERQSTRMFTSSRKWET